MKKIIPIIFCTMMLSVAFGQRSHRDREERDSYHDSYGNTSDNYNPHKNDYERDRRRHNIYQRDLQIQRISSRYDYQIEQVSCDRSLSRREKKYAIRALQAQKAEQVKRIYFQFNNGVYTYGGYGNWK